MPRSPARRQPLTGFPRRRRLLCPRPRPPQERSNKRSFKKRQDQGNDQCKNRHYDVAGPVALPDPFYLSRPDVLGRERSHGIAVALMGTIQMDSMRPPAE